MAVYERGYRPYLGKFDGAPTWWVIQDTAARSIMRTKSAKFFLGLFGLLFLASGFGLYFLVGVTESMEEFMRKAGGARSFEDISVRLLQVTITGFYFTTSVLSALFCMFCGAGLIADDIRHRALSLYLVRPLRPIDYALGKAFVLPRLLFKAYLLPGLLFFLMTALWQEDISAATFIGRHIGIVGNLLHLWLITSLGVSGVMLLLSARHSSRGPVMGLAAAIFFGGIIVHLLGRGLAGLLGDAMRHTSVVMNGWGLLLEGIGGPENRPSAERMARSVAEFPAPTAGLVVGLVVFALGVAVAVRRAQSAEIAE